MPWSKAAPRCHILSNQIPTSALAPCLSRLSPPSWIIGCLRRCSRCWPAHEEHTLLSSLIDVYTPNARPMLPRLLRTFTTR